MTHAPGFSPGGRCGGPGYVSRAASFSVSHELQSPTGGRGWQRARWLQQEDLERVGSSVRRRYR
ncbi:MAG: hypothetical protein ACPIOQ_49140 [Promethearchaeia archaeon]